MGNWGEEWDEELKNREDPKGRFTPNFKKISSDMDKIINETANVDDKHPKNEILKEWCGMLVAFFVLFLLSYKVFVFVTIVLMGFYFMALYKIGVAWKHFKYNMGVFVIMNIGALASLFVIATVIKSIVMK